MKIFFRYLFMRILGTFAVCLAACTVIWVMVDLYGNLDDFLEHKVKFLLVLRFYLLRVPQMMVQVLPAAMLFSTLFTLLSMNRRSELVALQSGGIAPLAMFSPFLLFATLWVIVLAYDLSGPVAQAEVTRDRILKQVKGERANRGVFQNLAYVDDRIHHLIWFFGELDVGNRRGRNMEILQRDAQGHDMVKYEARRGDYVAGGFWRLGPVKKIVFGPDGSILEQKTFQELDLPEMTSTPQQLSLIISQPPQLTIGQLSEYIVSSSQSPDQLAAYRTEWWYRILYPFSVLILMLYALAQGGRSDRRSAVGDVVFCIVILFAFLGGMSVLLAMGRNNRLPAFIAATAMEFLFGGLGIYLLGRANGWGWQLIEVWRKWYGTEEEPPSLQS